VIFENIASKLEKIGPIFSSCNPFPSLPSALTKLDPYFWNSIDAKALFTFLKRY